MTLRTLPLLCVLPIAIPLAACATSAATTGAPRTAEGPSVCVVQDGELRNVPVAIHPTRGDTLAADGRPLSSLREDAYAAGTGWYTRSEPIVVRGLNHVKYGAPRVFAPGDLVRVGEHAGVGLYALARDDPWRGLTLVPERRGCVFQAYEPPHGRE
jgi:hypothetical protein